MIAKYLKWYHFLILSLSIFFLNGWLAGISHIIVQAVLGNIFGEFPGVMWVDYDVLSSNSSYPVITIPLTIFINGLTIYFLQRKGKLNFTYFILVQIIIDILFIDVKFNWDIAFFGKQLLANFISLTISSVIVWYLLIRFLITEEHNYFDTWINKLNKSSKSVLLLLLFTPELLMIMYWVIDKYSIPDEAGCFGSISITGPIFSLLIISLSIFMYIAIRPFLDKDDGNRILMADLKMSAWPILIFTGILIFIID